MYWIVLLIWLQILSTSTNVYAYRINLLNWEINWVACEVFFTSVNLKCVVIVVNCICICLFLFFVCLLVFVLFYHHYYYYYLIFISPLKTFNQSKLDLVVVVMSGAPLSQLVTDGNGCLHLKVYNTSCQNWIFCLC